MHQTKIVQFAQAPTAEELRALEAKGLTVTHVSKRTHQVTVDFPLVVANDVDSVRLLTNDILAMSSVQGLEDIFEVRVVLDEAPALVHLAALWGKTPVPAGLTVSVFGVGARGIQAELSQGQGIVVGIIDTGIDLTYPDFQGRILSVKDYTGKGSVQDGHGHGTHCAGIVGQDGQADRRFVGVAPRVKFRIYKALADNGSGQSNWIAQAMEEAVDAGCHVISMSLGGTAPSAVEDHLQRVADAIAAEVIVVVAAGNEGAQSLYRSTPGRAAKVLTVGASDKTDKVAPFTTRGVTDQVQGSRVKPNVYAPGVNIGAAKSSTGAMGTPVNSVITRASGTSMATPFVAGLVACLLSADGSLKGKMQQVKAIFMDGGIEIGGEGLRCDGQIIVGQAYPPESHGVDKVKSGGPPEPEPESPCEPELMELLSDPAFRSKLVKRFIPAARRAFRSAVRDTVGA